MFGGELYRSASRGISRRGVSGAAVLLGLASSGWPTSAAAAAGPTETDLARFNRIVAETPLIDGHNDLPWELRRRFQGNLGAIDLRRDSAAQSGSDDLALQTDLPRLRKGGVGAQFWSVYVPSELKGAAATEAVNGQIDLTYEMISRYSTELQFAASAADIMRIHRSGRIASLLGMEGGEAIANDLSILRKFRLRGVLYLTLTHETTIDWVDSATDAPRHGGLAPFGEEVVREMNRLGMLVDLSHVSAEAMRGAISVSRAPVIFSHSSAFALTQHPRNVPDDVLGSLKQNGGLVMVNFYRVFVSEAHRVRTALLEGERATLAELFPGAPVARAAALRRWLEEHPRPTVGVADVADHIEHIRDVAGVDHVGLGADFDGMPDPPEGLGSVAGYPNLFAELMRRGWSDRDMAKLAGGNLLRVLRDAEV